MTQPPAPQPPAAAQPTGIIRLTIQGSEMTTSMAVPTARINGHTVPTRYGAQDLTVFAGRNHIDLEAQWMRTYGQAGLDVDVAPGQVVEVFYAAPMHQFTTGNIGFEKQKRPGMGYVFGCLGLLAVFFVLMIILMVFL